MLDCVYRKKYRNKSVKYYTDFAFLNYLSAFNHIFLFFTVLSDSGEAAWERPERLLSQYDVASCAFS